PLDVHGRMDVNELKTAIDEYLEGTNTDDGKKHPIITVVAVFGTTEEGLWTATKNLTKILQSYS
ncbi:MAG: hypothetical protein WBM32_05600, partial [Crocosphaera sp.]